MLQFDTFELVDIDYCLCKGIKFCKEMVASHPEDDSVREHYILQIERLEKLRLKCKD